MTTTVFGSVLYTAAGSSKTGLTVTGIVNVYAVPKGNPAGKSLVVTNGNAIEIGLGVYCVEYASADLTANHYLAVFTTADTTVDSKALACWMEDEWAKPGDAMALTADQAVNITKIAGSAVATGTAQLGVNLVNIAGAAVATGMAQLGVNAVQHGGTVQTGRDIGASVLLSAGTGTGQLDFTSGVVKANLAQILGTALTETAGYLAAGFKKFFNVASPAHTVASVDQTGDSYARIGAAGAGLTAVGDVRMANLDAAVSSRTKPADTQAAVTTVTNLTNAPTAGDFTATMKTSITAAVPSAATIQSGLATDAHVLAIPTNPLLASGYTAPPTVGQIDTQLTATHGAGTWGGAGGGATAQQIDTQLSGTHGSGAWGGAAGSGAIAKTLTIDDGTNPLDGVYVKITSDQAGTHTVASGTTNAFGNVTFQLDAGTYYAWCQRAGTNFSNPTTVTVP